MFHKRKNIKNPFIEVLGDFVKPSKNLSNLLR